MRRMLWVLLWVVTAFWRGGPTWAHPVAADPFADDGRMAARQTLRFKNVAIRDFLADLNEQTGIRFFADTSVAGDRITIVTHDRPLAETLRAVAAFYQAEWQRDGAKGNYGYTLQETRDVRQREEAEVTARLDSLTDMIALEAQEFERLAPLSQRQRETIEEGLPEQTAQAKDVSLQQRLRIDSIVLQDLRERRPWKPLAYQLLRGLSREQLSALTHSATTYYAWPSIPGCQALPPPVLAGLRRVLSHDYTSATASPRGEVVSLRLRFTLVAGRLPYIRMMLQVGLRSVYGFNTYGMGAVLPAAYNLLTQDAGDVPPSDPADWQTDPDLAATVTLRLPAETVAGRRKPDLPGQLPSNPVYWLSDALESLDRIHPVELIADAFWSTHIAGFEMKELPVGEVLHRLARMTGHRWWKQDGFVMIRSQHYVADRWAEPPATTMARWRDDAEHGLFRLDDYAEIAALPDAQAMTLQEMALAGQFPTIFSPLNNARSHLVLWAALTPAQRRKATAAGVAYQDLTAAQKRLYVLAATDPYSSPLSSDVPDDKLLTRAHLRLDTQEHGYWGVRRSGSSSTWRVGRGSDADGSAASRKEALRQFQQLDAGIKLTDVQPMVLSIVAFHYESERQTFSQVYIQLPPRWESLDAAE